MHVYASLSDAKQYAVDEGVAWGAGSTNDQLALTLLESVSAHVDDWCRRSSFGSGFGPRIGTNRYDATGGTILDLFDDLLTTTSVTSLDSTAAATSTSPAADTDYYLLNQKGQYDPAPYRRAKIHGQGDVTQWGNGKRVISWAGTWGYAADTRTLADTAAEAIDASETAIDVSGLTELSAGMVILIDSEQMYVRQTIDDTTDSIVVDRGVNGTTAATHLTASAIARYVYDSRVVEGTMRVWLKRWAARNASANGSDGSNAIGVLPQYVEGEDTILRRTVGRLRLMGRP